MSRWGISQGLLVWIASSFTSVPASAEPLTLTLVPVGGSEFLPSEVLTVEALLTANEPIRIEGGQIDVPCSTPSLQILAGLAGGTTDPDGDGSRGPSSGGIPFLFGANGLGIYQSATCIIALTPMIAGSPVNLAAGSTRYVGTYYYTVGGCAAVGAGVGFECTDQPGGQCDSSPESTNTTRFREDEPPEPGAGPLVPLALTAASFTVCRTYGDLVPPYCTADSDDILYVLGGFIDPAMFPEADLDPCGGGDGDVDVDDIVAELDAFTGFYACSVPCTP